MLFAALVSSFCIIYFLYYPATYSIWDESETLILSYSLTHGTIYLDRVGLTAGLGISGHNVSLYSPFHAALLAPALLTRWHLGFAITGAFFLLGAFVIRGMLAREGLSPGWCVLYFLNPGALYYSQTLMAAVPAASMGLLGASLLLRPAPQVVLGALALGCGVLLHPWMGPLAVVFSAVWLLENRGAGFIEHSIKLVIGALPAVASLAAYNLLITGSPFQTAYSALGLYREGFHGAHFVPFTAFYTASLALFPLAGWAVLSPRWAKGWALPAWSAAAIALASVYYYRDGMNFQRAGLLPFLAGAIPGQRFLLPVSFLACVPAARCLSGHLSFISARLYHWTGVAGAALFVAGFSAISVLHQNYLRAHATIQQTLNANIPGGTQVVVSSIEACKELVTVHTIRRCVDGSPSLDGNAQVPPEAYLMWVGPPGTQAPEEWFVGRHHRVVRARSWIWKADVWIGNPRT